MAEILSIIGLLLLFFGIIIIPLGIINDDISPSVSIIAFILGFVLCIIGLALF